MRIDTFDNMFHDHIYKLLDSQEQLEAELPELLLTVENEDLKVALKNYKETISLHIKSLKKIISQRPEEKNQRQESKGMQAFIKELKEIASKKTVSPIKDAVILAILLKISYFVHASYMSLTSFAKFLEYSAIYDLLVASLNSEIAVGKALTTIADGKFYKKGLNEIAEKESE